MMKNVVILISGRGSNMQAIVEANIPNANIAAVVSNVPDAAGLKWAEEKGIATAVLNHKEFKNRAEFDMDLAMLIDGYKPDLVVLAGFLRILSPAFCRHFQGRLLNIHPSLLPSFKGLHTHEEAIKAGCKLAGCTVHFVTEELDSGAIVAQAAVPVLANDTADTLAERVLKCEHKIYPQAVADFVSGSLKLENGTVVNISHTDENAFILGQG